MIAFVEDDVLTRERVTAALRRRGFEVRCYRAVADAIGPLETQPPDLLITEAALADGASGLELIARLRDATTRAFPVIVASHRGSEQDILRGYAAGATDYVTKPYTTDELLAKAVVHLARGERERTTLGPLELPTREALAFGRYRVGQPLGQGASGVVYSATDRETGRTVALKVLTLLEDLRAETRLRFLREVYAVSAVHDAHVAQVVDFGCAEGRLFYAMERVDGPTLHRRVAEGLAGEAHALALLDGLARALVALGRAELVHRDLKPGNVILREGRWDEPVLIDFGLAKRPFDRGLTAPDVWTGTPGYIPPEVVLGGRHDARGDLFSLGLVARFALTGEEPFPALRGLSLLYHMTREQVSLPADISPGLARLLFDLTRLDPEDRPPSAEDVLRRVDAVRRARRARAA